MPKLTLDFYQREDVIAISRELLGKVLMTRFACPNTGKLVTTGGIIIETEAYCAPEDKASHAYNNRRTKRTETMFCAGGVAYVYLCYGIHSLFNVVTGYKDLPHGVLIRAIQPIIGIEQMLERRKQKTITKTLTSGPGVLTAALGITTAHDQTLLTGRDIWIEDQGIKINEDKILATPRIGIGYAQDFVLKPWRFLINE